MFRQLLLVLLSCLTLAHSYTPAYFPHHTGQSLHTSSRFRLSNKVHIAPVHSRELRKRDDSDASQDVNQGAAEPSPMCPTDGTYPQCDCSSDSVNFNLVFDLATNACLPYSPTCPDGSTGYPACSSDSCLTNSDGLTTFDPINLVCASICPLEAITSNGSCDCSANGTDLIAYDVVFNSCGLPCPPESNPATSSPSACDCYQNQLNPGFDSYDSASNSCLASACPNGSIGDYVNSCDCSANPDGLSVAYDAYNKVCGLACPIGGQVPGQCDCSSLGSVYNYDSNSCQ